MTAIEVRTLRAAFKQASRAHVPREFRRSYRQHRMSGDSVEAAAWCALYDWDALDIVVDGGEVALGYKIEGWRQGRAKRG